MAAGNVHPDDDDFGDLDIRKKPSGSNATLFIVLACGIILVVLLSCAGGVAFIGMMEHRDRPVPKQVVQAKVLEPVQDPEAVKLLGAWKSRFVLNGQQRDHRYTFRKDGTLREDELDQGGGVIRVSEARWRFRNGQIEIDWRPDVIEIATARWLDKDSFEYHILQHTDGAQVGMKETFRRQ